MKKSLLAALVACLGLFLFVRPALAQGMEGMAGGAHGEDHMMGGMPWFGRVPIGVKGGTTHHAGKWMFSYRYMYMGMEGNRNGTDSVSTEEVLRDYMVSPTEMSMQMHMLGIMYGATSNLTLMAMAPYVRLEMDHVTRMGGKFTTKTDGLGDLKLSALYLLPNPGKHTFHVNAGISFPTGSVDEKGDTPAGPDQKLPYPMQLGSGTYDLLAGLTYRGLTGAWQWGGQAAAVFRIGENKEDYTLGNRFQATGWLTRLLGGGFSASARLDWNWWDDIDGADPELNPAVVPTADPDLRGGNRIDALLGLNFVHGQHSLAVEGGVPIYQDLHGPQLETDWLITAGYQLAF